MAAPKYLDSVSGQNTQKTAAVTSTPDAIVALDGSGKINSNMLPTGVGPEVKTMTTSENLAAGDYVDVYLAGSPAVATARKADATTGGKQADGFVLASTTSGQDADVYGVGINDQVSGMTPGDTIFLTTTPGLGSGTPPSGSNNIVQPLGVALSATEVAFTKQPGVVLA